MCDIVQSARHQVERVLTLGGCSRLVGMRHGSHFLGIFEAGKAVLMQTSDVVGLIQQG